MLGSRKGAEGAGIEDEVSPGCNISSLPALLTSSSQVAVCDVRVVKRPQTRAGYGRRSVKPKKKGGEEGGPDQREYCTEGYDYIRIYTNIPYAGS